MSRITDFSNLFQGNLGFDQDVSNWVTSEVTTMAFAFDGAAVFAGTGVGNWDVSKVTDFEDMFKDASSFDADLSKWNVAAATNMSFMFLFATSFKGSGLDGWSIGNVRNLFGTFNGATKFATDISAWDVSSVTDFTSVLESASVFSADLCLWGTKITSTDSSLFGQGPFVGTSCSNTGDPDLAASPKGPFCAKC